MSVMLRCKCGFEVTVPDEVASGIVTCPACHQEIDPAVSVIHPSLDDLDPELLLAPDDDEPASAAPNPPTSAPAKGAAPVAESLDDLSMLVDVEPAIDGDSGPIFLMDDEPAKPTASAPESAAPSMPQHEAEPSEVHLPDLEGAISAPLHDASLLGTQTPTILPPDDDDEGYAVMEEDYSTPAAKASWTDDLAASEAVEEPSAPSTGKRPAPVLDDEDEIQIADEALAAKPAKPAAKPKPTGPRDALDDLLDDDINIKAEPVAPKPIAAAVTACPSCNTPLDAGAVLCIHCGFNLKTGKKVEASPLAAGGKAAEKSPLLASLAATEGGGKGLAGKLNWSDPRVKIGAAGLAAALLLGIAGFFVFGGNNQPATPTAANPQTPAAPTSGDPNANPPAEIPGEQPPSTTPATAGVDSSQPQLKLLPQGINGKAVSLDLDDENLFLAVGTESGTAVLFDLEKGEIKHTLTSGANGAVQVDLNSAGKQVVTGFAGGAKLWNVEDGKEERSFKTPVDGAWQTRFIKQGDAFFTSGPTGLLSVVDLTAGGKTRSVKLNLPAELQPVVDVSADGKLGIVGGDDGLLAVWDVSSGLPAKQLLGHTTKIAAVAISADGTRVLSAAGGPEYRVVDQERWLASNRPADFNVRLWDVATGKELFRLPLPADKPCTCLAFSPDGKLAVIVAGDVHIIDLASRQRLATIAPAAQGSSDLAATLPLPTEPFRLAKFFKDGMRLVTAGQTNGVQIWELPAEPKPSAIPGLVEPLDLAGFKPAADAVVTPLEIVVDSTAAATAGADDEAAKALAARQAISAKAAEVSAAKDKKIAAFRKALMAEPTTVDRLWQLAEICYRNELPLEAEECLRGLLLAQPNHAKAPKVYAMLGKSQPDNVGPLSPSRAWGQRLDTLDDAGQQPDPPRNSEYVSLPLDVSVVGKGTKIDASTVTAKAGDKPAAFLGIHHRATGEVTGAKKGSTMTGQAQVWEAMAVATDRDGKTIVQFLNRRIPQTDQPRANAPTSSSTPKVKLVADSSKVKEDYAGPYQAIFVVPQGESLTEIQWEETQPIYLLGEEPQSLDEVALDAKASTAERLAAIKAIGASPTAAAVATLEQVITAGDDKLFAAARAALRQVRRKGNLIDPEFLPVAKPEDARLYAISQGKLDAAGMNTSGAGFGGGATGPSALPAISQYSYCKTVWKITQPGKYKVRIASFGPAPQFAKQQSVEFEWNAADANWYVVTAKVDREVEFDSQLVELWLGNTLQERRFLARNPWDTSALAASLKLAGMQADEGNAAGEPGAADAFNATATGVPGQPGTATPKIDPFADVVQVVADARPLFGQSAPQLPVVERAVLEELLHVLPADSQTAIPAIVVDVARLDTTSAASRDAALARLSKALGEAAPAVFARVAQVAHGPAALAAVESLRQLGATSALACRTLIDLQNGPADIKQAAEQAVSDLMTQGIIVQRGTNWLYHGETHFPEAAASAEETAPASS